MAVTELGAVNRRARVADFVELTKPRITLLVLITTLVGFYMGSTGSIQMLLLAHTIIGSGLIAAGAATGGRILANLTRELVRRDGRYGLETMCIGGGQGIAAIFERAA